MKKIVKVSQLILLIIGMCGYLISLYFMFTYQLGIPELMDYPFAFACFLVGLLVTVTYLLLSFVEQLIRRKQSKFEK